MKADYTRSSFIEKPAPRDQQCSCQCGQVIKRGSICVVRPYVEHGRVTGHTRLISLDHYDDWLENVAHAYANRIKRRRPELERYFE